MDQPDRMRIRTRVRLVERGTPTVVALGGGSFAQPANLDLLENNGVTIWLDCPFETVRRRVGQASHRPLARDPQRFEELYYSRRPAYARADYCIPIESDDPLVAVEAVLNLPLFT